jgi:hypothetical protein
MTDGRTHGSLEGVPLQNWDSGLLGGVIATLCVKPPELFTALICMFASPQKFNCIKGRGTLGGDEVIRAPPSWMEFVLS